MTVNPPPKQFVHGQILHSELRSPAFADASYGIRPAPILLAISVPKRRRKLPDIGKRQERKITEKCLSLSSVLRCFWMMR